jgi:undecaprenyl diphosphate synthase
MNQESAIPVHLGFILDGNRRWARSQGLSTFEGHQRGYNNLKDIAKYAFSEGVSYVSAFIFSIENWSRTKTEVKYLLDLALRFLTTDLADLKKENIKVVCLGSREKLSKKLISAIENAEEKTKNNSKGTLAICFNYGGQQEIIDATKKIVTSGIRPNEITIDKFIEALYAPDVPPVDLIIRTSGERRISGFMLYRAAYAELYFTEKHWPEFTESDLDTALLDYSKRQRRFGK